MTKRFEITVTGVPEELRSKTYVIEEGDDWDGRPVGDQFDASDLAWDFAVEDEFFYGVVDLEIVDVEISEDE